MSADVERGLLVLLREAAVRNGTEMIDLRQFGSGPPVRAIEETSSAAALVLLASGVKSGRGPDLTAAVQGMVLGSQIFDAGIRDDAETPAELEPLAHALLRSVGVDTARSPALINAVKYIRGADSVRLDSDGQGAFVSAFGDRLRITASEVSPQLVTLRGPAAGLAAQLVDVANLYSASTHCDAEFVPDPISGKDVTVVTLEACTSLPYETCRQRIDPRRWPDCNPYFVSVTEIPPCTPTNDGWYGDVHELVGPGVNLKYYATDLGVRYLEQSHAAIAAFDLTHRHPPGAVTVDRGFVSVIDEGPHRRIQVAKVYRIEDLHVEHSWVCPLWASQVVVAGWACSMAESVRRAMKAWSVLTHEVLTSAQHVCDSVHCDCDRARPRARTSRVGPLDIESYEVPVSYDCDPSDAGTPGSVRVPVPLSTSTWQFGAGTAYRLVPGLPALEPHAVRMATSVPGNQGSTVISLPPGVAAAAPGVYVGHLSDTAKTIEVPYTIYVSGA